MAGLAVVAVVVAPTVDARPNCDQTNSTTVCQTNGSVSIKANPGTVSSPTGAGAKFRGKPAVAELMAAVDDISGSTAWGSPLRK